jgi:hypothetical protein
MKSAVDARFPEFKGKVRGTCHIMALVCKPDKDVNGNDVTHCMLVTNLDVNGMIPGCGHCTDRPPKLYKIKNKVISFDVPSIKMHIKKLASNIGYPNIKIALELIINDHYTFDTKTNMLIDMYNYIFIPLKYIERDNVNNENVNNFD